MQIDTQAVRALYQAADELDGIRARLERRVSSKRFQALKKKDQQMLVDSIRRLDEVAVAIRSELDRPSSAPRYKQALAAAALAVLSSVVTVVTTPAVDELFDEDHTVLGELSDCQDNLSDLVDMFDESPDDAQLPPAQRFLGILAQWQATNGLSNNEVADRIGASRDTVRSWFAGSASPTGDEYGSLARLVANYDYDTMPSPPDTAAFHAQLVDIARALQQGDNAKAEQTLGSLTS